MFRLLINRAFPGILFAVAILMTVALRPGYAQMPGEGVMNAISYAQIPKGVPIHVRPLDNSDDNIVLQMEFERLLKLRGYTISINAPLIMSFETRETLGSWTGGGRTILELDGRAGSGSSDRAQARVSLFDTKRGGVFNRGADSPVIANRTEYRLDVSVENRAGGKRLWQGWITATTGSADRRALNNAMVPEIVDNLGFLVDQHRFSLP